MSNVSADNVYGVWADTIRELVSYRYIGCQSVRVDREHAVGTTRLQPHLRHAGSPMLAALAISMLDTAGICIDPIYDLALTEIDVQLADPAVDVARLRTVGEWTREARTQTFTECRFEDGDTPGRVLGMGAANWSVIEAKADGFVYTDPGSGHAAGEAPDIRSAYGLEVVAPGHLRIPELSPRLGGLILHHGPMLVGVEQAAIAALADRHPGRQFAPQALSMRVVRGGRHAPFDVRAAVMTAVDRASVRVTITDGGGELMVVAHLLFASVRIS